jgi:hypothetical protein
MRKSDHSMTGKDAVRPALEALRRTAIAAAFALAGTTGALALSELPQQDMPVPEESEDAQTIERHDLPPLKAPESAQDTQKGEDEADENGADKNEPGEEEAPEAGDAAPATPAAPRDPQRVTVPFPDPIVSPRDPGREAQADGEDAAEKEPVPEVLYDLSLLPEPGRRMRDLIAEACLSGDIERLRPYISTGENATQLSFGDVAGDPIAFLRELSGDDEGHEILAILYEVLSAGYVKLGEGTPEEMYVWPYFFAVPLDALTAPQRVELFKIVTAGDYEDMKNYGAYIFYRTGISPEGRWMFFVAGD